MKTKISIQLLFFLLFFSFSCTQDKKEPDTVTFAVCTDVHKDIMHDADERLQAFIDTATKENVDFIIQLGDFCRPAAENNDFLNIFNSFKGDKYHVLGNHDMDSGYTRADNLIFWNQPKSYFSFNKNKFHFIVLDGNDTTSPPQDGYPHFIGDEQIKWLKNDIKEASLPIIVFSHQSLFDPFGTENDSVIRQIFEEENHKNNDKKIIACFNGHAHVDRYEQINGIWYFEFNSMSYYWIGKEYQQIRYNEAIDKTHPSIKYTAPYKDPLFAIVRININGTINLKGQKSEWVGLSPEEMNFNREGYEGMVKPEISDTIIKPQTVRK